MAIDPARVKSLFQSAIGRDDPDERRAFLDQEIGDDAELRDRLDALLVAHDLPPGVLDRPLDPDHQATAELPDATGDFSPKIEDVGHRPGPEPSPIDSVIAGRYKLRQEIGEGGMGRVYLAEQLQPVKRLVALKLIKPGMDSRTVLARFESERQALALMDHPHIAKVLDAGTTEHGRPFFVMELVKGIPLTDYCDRHQLDLPARLSLFRQICSAVQHAHQKGIIHRDLKPTNILVESHDGKPVPKVIDFGLAKATSGLQLSERSLFTAFGSVTGTPLYMAPEQATFNALDVDTRADIYALGVILYELLTGSTPIQRDTMQRAALDEMLRVIREVEPPTPSSRISTSEGLPGLAANRHVEPSRLSRLVKGDLDWIVMKALAKERNRRYDSAIGLANDVERYLNHEPVTAGPPGAAYRLRKFVRRNRGQVAAAALVLLALVLGVVGTTLGLIEARRQERIAIAEAVEKEKARLAEAEQRAKADASRQQAEKRLAQVAKMNEILGSIFQDLDPYKDRKDNKPLTAILGERLDRAAAEIEGEATGDPIAVARMQVILGVSLDNLGQPRKALELLIKARATLAAGLGADHPDTLNCMGDLAMAYHENGEMARSLALSEETLALQRARLGIDHPNTLRSVRRVASGCSEAGQQLRVIKLCEEALPSMRARLGVDDKDTLRCMQLLGEGYAKTGQSGRAVKVSEESHKLMSVKLGPDHPRTLGLKAELANCYRDAGQTARAVKLHEEVLAMLRSKVGPDHPHTLIQLYNVAATLVVAGEYARAEPLFEELVASTRKIHGEGHFVTFMARQGRAWNDVMLGRLDVAEPALRAIMSEALAVFGAANAWTPSTRVLLAQLLEKRGDAASAVSLYRASLDESRRGKDDRCETAERLADLGRALLATKEWAEAGAVLREALAIDEAERPDHWQTPDARSLLGGALLGQGKVAEAGPLLRSGREGLAGKLDAIPAYHRTRLAEALDRLIAFGEATGKLDEVQAWKAERAKLEFPSAGKKP